MTVLNTISYDPKKIIDIVSKEFHVSKEEITGDNHKHHVCDARHVAMYLIRLKNPGLSQVRIGAYFGNPKYAHAKVMVDSLLKSDKEFKLRFELCKVIINSRNGRARGRPKKAT